MDTRIIEIEKYWADVVRNTAEFQQIANAQNPEFNTLVGCIQRILQDAFINDATEYGVERWEKMLKIAPALTDTLETRKVRILTYLSFKTPYTWRTLEQMIVSYVGDGKYTMKYINDTSTLVVRLFINDVNQRDLIANLLSEVLPQNIVVDLAVQQDYVKFDGTFYFDTGIVGNQDTAYEMVLTPAMSLQYNAFGCNTSTGYVREIYLYASDPSPSLVGGIGINPWFYGNTDARYSLNYFSSTSATVDSRYKVYSSAQKITIYDYDNNHTETKMAGFESVTDFSCDGTLWIGAINGGSSLGFDGRIYGCRIWQAGKLVRDFIPSLDGNGLSCLYDNVEKKYYYRQNI